LEAPSQEHVGEWRRLKEADDDASTTWTLRHRLSWKVTTVPISHERCRTEFYFYFYFYFSKKKQVLGKTHIWLMLVFKVLGDAGSLLEMD
jgi:hypothetical protein